MSVKLNDFWISDVLPAIGDDISRLQKMNPTGKSGKRCSAKALFTGEVIAKASVQTGGWPAIRLVLILIQRK